MTSAEQQQLAAIERHLIDESPGLAHALTGGRHRDPADRRRWALAGMASALVSLVLLVVGIGVGVPALAVSSLCPVSTYLLMAVMAQWLRGRSARLG